MGSATLGRRHIQCNASAQGSQCRHCRTHSCLWTGWRQPARRGARHRHTCKSLNIPAAKWITDCELCANLPAIRAHHRSVQMCGDWQRDRLCDSVASYSAPAARHLCTVHCCRHQRGSGPRHRRNPGGPPGEQHSHVHSNVGPAYAQPLCFECCETGSTAHATRRSAVWMCSIWIC